MAERKKISTDELYASKQWSDNMSFSREAINESKKKKTSQLSSEQPEEEPPKAHSTGRLPATKGKRSSGKARSKTSKPTTNHLDQYVQEMNDEMGRISDTVGQTIDTVGERLSRSVNNMVSPIGEGLTRLAEALVHGLHSMTVGVAKAIVVEFTVVLRTISEKLGLGGGGSSSKSTVSQASRTVSRSKTAPIPHGTQPLTLEAPQAPAPAMGFGLLLEQKIFFSTIHNRPFLTELDIKEYQPGNTDQEYQWMTRAIEEIKNCAPYGQKLPTPTKGPFLGIPMFDVLSEVDYEAIERFTTFVANRPQPFQQKALKLSEAYATWVHKGAPEK